MLPALAVALAVASAQVAAAGVSPVQKVVQLLTDLEAKVSSQGQEAETTHKAYLAWCEDRSKNLQFEIRTGEGEVSDLKAAAEKAVASIQTASTKLEDLAGSLASNEADLKAATGIRAKEEADFAAAEAELVEVADALQRAIGILEREARKGGASMLQLPQAASVVQAVRAMVDASLLGSRDGAALAALVQSSGEMGEMGDAALAAFQAPEAAAYESHGGSIVETLEGLLEQARAQLEDARKKETASRHSFELLKQSLEDELQFGNQDLEDERTTLAEQGQKRAVAEGGLSETSKSLAEDQKTASTLEQDCRVGVQDYESAVKSRAEELKALSEAKKAILESTGGANDLAYGLAQASFLQLRQSGGSLLRTGADLANFEAVRFVRSLARRVHSEALAQLARRMATTIRSGAGTGDDPFAKVKTLIRDMLETLGKESQADATHKAYCDKELGETLAKRSAKEAAIEKLSTKIDAATATSAQLKDEVAALQSSLADLAASQAEASRLREAERSEFARNKPEMESGLEGVKMALKILREYYAKGDRAHDAQEGGSSGIVGLLEVVESDFSRLLAELSTAEATAQADYGRETREAAIQRATKGQDVKYKTKQHTELDLAIAEATSDRSGVQAELSAILEYNTHLEDMCVEKPEAYSERKGRREVELEGLKQALSILDGEAVLLQRRLRLRRGRPSL